MAVLILSSEGDTHAAAVRYSLHETGHSCTLVDLAAFPDRSAMGIEFKGGAFSFSKRLDIQPGDVVWNRRPNVDGNSPRVADSGGEIAFREKQLFLAGLLSIAEARGRWVNSYWAYRRSMNKLRQMEAGSNIGLAIPDYIVSNDLSACRRFIKTAPSECVLKSFYPIGWAEGSRTFQYFTQVIAAERLPTDEPGDLYSLPLFIQRRIDKKYEVRATFFGPICIAIRINSRCHELAQQDWRQVNLGKLNPELVELPAEVLSHLRRLMIVLGLQFGCVDLIVDAQDTWWFLEVNQQGQFLFVEQFVPEIPMLGYMCQFLVDGEIDPRSATNEWPRLAEVPFTRGGRVELRSALDDTEVQ